MGKIGTTSTRYHHIVTSKYGRFLCNPIPSFRFVVSDPKEELVFLCSPLLQSPTRQNLIRESDGPSRQVLVQKSDDSAHLVIKAKNGIGCSSITTLTDE